jgi:hypothetical protein
VPSGTATLPHFSKVAGTESLSPFCEKLKLRHGANNLTNIIFLADAAHPARLAQEPLENSLHGAA